MQISKSEYMMFLKHPAFLWLKKFDKTKLPPIDDNLQAIFDAGNLFETYAEQLFDNPTRVGFDNYDEYLSMPERTKAVIANGATVITQGRFETPLITCICDVVEIVEEGVVDLIEIKSGTGVKQDHIYDLAFQCVVLQECGFRVRNVSVVHVNSFYIRKGEIKARELCATTEVTSEVFEEIDDTRELIRQAHEILLEKKMPELTAPGEGDNFYGWRELYTHLNPSEPGSIFDLCWPKQRIAELHAMGIKMLADIPDTFPLSPKQKHQVSAVKNNKVSIDTRKIYDFISEFVFPLYFLDYETLSGIVPAFDGLSPYNQLPFQYSLHVLESPNGPLRHATYLHRENIDPCTDITESLKKEIGNEGSIVVWNASFEKGCNTLIGKKHREYAKFYAGLNERIVDLAIPFQKNWYVNKDFVGSYSIKKVLPVLVPELSYKELGINEGGAAQRLWMGSVLDTKYADQKEQILADLEKYCELDTLAMVKIYEVLFEAVSGDMFPGEQLSML